MILNDVSQVYQPWFEVPRHGAFLAHDVTLAVPAGRHGGDGGAGRDAAGVVHDKVLRASSSPTRWCWPRCCTSRARPARARRAWVGDRRPCWGRWYARYDVLVTAVAVAALLVLRRRLVLGGALAAVGALLKVAGAAAHRHRPLAAPPGAPGPRRPRPPPRLALFALTMTNSSFLTMQADRGTEVESLGALVFHLGRHAGWHGRVRMHYGSMEFLGLHVHLVSTAALLLSVLAFCWLVVAAAGPLLRPGDAVRRRVHRAVGVHHHQPRDQPPVHGLADRRGRGA